MMKKINFQKLSSSLLALAVLGSFSIMSTQEAQSRAYVDDMQDVRSDHWAYNAIKELVDKYDVMSGFPDNTFRGARTFTRYEAAAALYKVMLKVEELTKGQVVRPPLQNNSSVSGEDLKTLKELVSEFRRELDALKASNASQDAKIKSVEEDIEKVKKDLGKIRLGGDFEAGFDDTLEDTYRPGYYTNYVLNMKANVFDDATFRGSFKGEFNSAVEEKEENGVKKKVDSEIQELKFADAWFNYAPSNVAFNPKVKFGYMGFWNLLSAGTSITNYFPNGTSVANGTPNVNGGKNRGIRMRKTVTGGIEIGNGPFSATIAATPQTLGAMLKMDFGFAKVKLLADADQTLFFGEIVQDPIHNEAVVVDIGNDNFGISGQANFRGVADTWQFRAASGLVFFNLANFEIGAVGKFENESTQQIIAGGFLKTPDKIGDRTIPSLQVTVQEPLTLLNGSIIEGSNLGDKAGINVSLTYDNPFLPNLSIYFDQKSNILFSSDPKDIIASTYGLYTSTSF
ncbi:MAG: S-layer homology domain-containing protein [Candidatus Sericytochromatia bacterium]